MSTMTQTEWKSGSGWFCVITGEERVGERPSALWVLLWYRNYFNGSDSYLTPNL